MSLSVTNRGFGTHNTGATSFTLSPGSNFAAGATAVLCISADNSSSGGATNDFTTVTDSLGNTWTKRQSPVFDNGAASAGVQGAIYDCEQNVGTLQTGTVITVNFGSSPVAKTWTLTEISAAAGFQAKFRTGANKSAGATGTAATLGASPTVNIGEVIVAAFFMEAGTTQTYTGDSDTTNGTWSTAQYAEIGSTTSGSCCGSQAKLQTTANSTQTYDATLGISSDYHGSYAIFTETQITSSGALDVTIDAVNSSAAGTVRVAGAEASTIDPVTSSAVGVVAITGIESSTIAAVTISADGTVSSSGISGALAITIDPVNSSAAGTVVVAGAESSTIDPVTSSAAGTVVVQGALAITIDPATSSAAGTVRVAGAAASTIDPVTSSAGGAVLVQGAASSSIGAVAISADGTLGSSVSGTLTVTIDPVVASATGAVLVQGAASDSIGAVAIASAGTVRVAGAEASTIDPVTSSAAGNVRVAGAESTTIAAVTSSAAGVVLVQGSLSQSTGEITLAGGSSQAITGALAATIDPVTSSAAAAVRVAGALAAGLAPVASSAAAAVRVAGTAAAALAPVTSSAAGVVLVRGALDSTIGPVVLVPPFAPVLGALSASAGEVILEGTGETWDRKHSAIASLRHWKIHPPRRVVAHVHTPHDGCPAPRRP